jgi:aldose 1-epimerase
VTEVGATLRTYSVGDVDVIDGFSEKDMCQAGRGQVLAPWPNRLGDGRYSIDGRNAQAALDEPERGCAIHGIVRWQTWNVLSRAQNVVVLGCVVNPQPGYPWRLACSVEYRLGRDGLTVTAEVTNLDQHPAPFGIGFHPYISTSGQFVDDAKLRVPARGRLLTDERGLPVGETVVTGSEFDFREPRIVGETRLDTAFCALDRDGDGRAHVTVTGAQDDAGAEVWMEERFRYVMVYTGDTLEPASRRRRGIAIEPMTCPPDALRTGVDLIRLEPGASWRGAWGVSPS